VEGEQPQDRRVGTVLHNRYLILAPIAQGGMGSVYRAERLQLGRQVAIKFLHAWVADDPALRQRFEVEARAMSRLSQPNCISVLDFGVADAPYIVMDLVAGKTLNEVLAEGALPPARALAIARQLLAGLVHAHAQGIIHRDIKPENIVLEEGPDPDDRVRLLDFGLAKLVDSQPNATAGMALGTPNYMAPEQLADGAVGERTDIYATGIVLFEMLTGRKPFDSPEIGEVFRQHLYMPPPALRSMAPAANHSPELEAVVQRALAKSPAERFPTAAAMAAALEATPEARGAPAAAPEPAPRTAHLPPPPPPLVIAARRQLARASRGVLAAAERGRAWIRGRGRRQRALLGASLAGVLVASIAAASLGRGSPPPAASAAAPAPARQGTDAPPGVTEAKRRSARLAAQRARSYFEKRSWSEGVTAFRAAVASDPGLAGDPVLVGHVIRSLQSQQFQAKGAAFLRQLGEPARPQIEEAARSHAIPVVRARAGLLLRTWPRS
jgi:serine/threonine-protein kinase